MRARGFAGVIAVFAIGLTGVPAASAGNTLAVCLEGDCTHQDLPGPTAAEINRLARAMCATATGQGIDLRVASVCVPTDLDGVTVAGTPYVAVTSQDFKGVATVGLTVQPLP